MNKTDGIAILYPGIYPSERMLFKEKISQLNQILQTNGYYEAQWVTESSHTRDRIKNPGVKIMTIHSSKGLQFEYVFMMHLDMFNFKDDPPGINKRLCYIGLTRTEKYLTLLHSGHSTIVESLIKSGFVDVVG